MADQFAVRVSSRLSIISFLVRFLSESNALQLERLYHVSLTHCRLRGPRTLCNACGLRAFRRRQRETRDTQPLDKKPKSDDMMITSPVNSPPQQTQALPAAAVNAEKMSVSFLTS